MSKKLDKDRDFATIYGDDEGRVFEQDGVHFRGDGTAWDENSAPPSVFESAPEPSARIGLLPPKKKRT